MTTTCRICGAASEAPEPSEDGSPSACARCHDRPESPGDHEPAYQDDLHSLIERTQSSMRARDEGARGIEVPPSVREAIRNAEAPIFCAAAAKRRPRVKLAAIPVIALALVGVVVGSAQGTRLDAAPPPATTAPVAPPAIAEAVVPPEEQATALAPEPPAPAVQASSAHAPPAAPSVHPATPRPPAVAAARPRLAASVTPVPAPAPDPPSLREAIINAVRSGPPPADRR